MDGLLEKLPESALCVLAGVWLTIQLVKALRAKTNGNGNGKKNNCEDTRVEIIERDHKPCPSEPVLRQYSDKVIEISTSNKGLVEAVGKNTRAVEDQTKALMLHTEHLASQNGTLVKLAEAIAKGMGNG